MPRETETEGWPGTRVLLDAERLLEECRRQPFFTAPALGLDEKRAQIDPNCGRRVFPNQWMAGDAAHLEFGETPARKPSPGRAQARNTRVR
jgi:hypothetical protein